MALSCKKWEKNENMQICHQDIFRRSVYLHFLLYFQCNFLGNFKLKVGDLVKLKESEDVCECCSERTGVILRLKNHHPDDSNMIITVAEILWEDQTKWVEVSRIEIC